ncbi:MAG: hypothetical protein H7210_00540, partial [Pyrinomonadaceae bacterium]|nr:hypothetical protein [Phycisphaerales bacterium]
NCSVNVTIETCAAASFDTKIAVYDNCPLVNTPAIMCSDDACPGLRSRVSFTATPNNQYVIRVGGYAGQSGTATLTISSSNNCNCPCNWNNDSSLNSQDFFDFLVAFFAGNADFNTDGPTNSQDFFDFVTCFFSPPIGCP